MTNSGGVKPLTAEEWVYYEMLPRDVRDFLKTSVGNWTASEVYRAVKVVGKDKAMDAIRRADERLRDKITREYEGTEQ